MKPLGFLTARRVIALAVIAALGVGSVFAVRRLTQQRSAVRYITRPAQYADIASTATETGTVNPVDQVQVGSQVSGTIATLNVDYNSRVHRGEVLATLDPTSFRAAAEQAGAALAAAQSTASASMSGVAQAQAAVRTAQDNYRQSLASVRNAEANAAKVKAQGVLAQVTVKRDASLLAQGYIAQNQMDTDRTSAQANEQDYAAAQASIAVAQAQGASQASQVRGAEQQVQTAAAQAAAAQHQINAAAAQLQQAQYNLSRTVITSPIDGVVMARNVSVGQTVAASLQTPTLFTIASNLKDMQVDTSVDEADVGNVRTGQNATITVNAYPNVNFSGTVQQVRVNPSVVQNVVTYDAVVLVHDDSGRLMPGMTAQVIIATSTRTHVLAVPMAALLFRPLQQGARPTSSSGGPLGGGGIFFGPGGPGGGAAAAPVAGAAGSQVTVWVLRNGRPVPVRVTIGVSDNRNVEITAGPLHEGDRVIIVALRGGRGGQAGRSGQGGQGGQAGSGGGGHDGGQHGAP